jgi:hypothetical protein
MIDMNKNKKAAQNEQLRYLTHTLTQLKVQMVKIEKGVITKILRKCVLTSVYIIE